MNIWMHGILGRCAVLAACAVAVAACGPSGESPSAPSAKQLSLGLVAQALSAANVMNAEANLAADYYIYVQSASWCGPCKAEMPELVKIYPQMKAANVELILMGLDGTPAEAKAYLDSYHAPFPGVHFEDPAASSLPGFALSRTVPHATIVDKDGKVIAKGHGSLARKWQQITEDDRAEK